MKNILSLLFTSSLALLAVSCKVDLGQDNAVCDQSGKEVSVHVHLDVAEESSNMPRTRSVDDPSDGIAPEIRNICVLQYDGKDDDARLVGDVHYYSLPSDAGNVLDDIRLVDSNGAEHTVVILANTFTRVPRFETLGVLLNQTRLIDCQADLFGHSGQGDGFPDDTSYYQRLNGIAVSVISDDTHLKTTLRRSMARIRIHITNTGKDDLMIHSVKLCNVPRKDYYISDYRYNSSDVLSLRDEPFHDQFDRYVPHLMDYPADTLDYTEGQAQDQYITYYATCNQRGAIVNDNPYLKNKLCVDNAATRLEVLGYYGPDHDKPIQYSFYLGADLKQDFNINPNTAYEYDITFNGKGNLESDSRISDLGGLDFDVDANCYILNPPMGGVASYSFNVVHRPNIFWGNRFGIDSNPEYINNYIHPTDKWYARIIWSDFEMTREEARSLLAVAEGDATGSYMDASQRVTINIPAGHPGGNVLIGIYKNPEAPEQIVWSWHLWITDYNPDKIAGLAPKENQYVYHVPGGQVIRFASDASFDGKVSIWAEGQRYANAYLMDRNLGSLSQVEAECKSYQHGRKDPFNNDVPVWTYDKEFNPSRVFGPDGKDNGMVTPVSYAVISAPSQIVDGVPNGGMNTGGYNVPYSVTHPTTFIANSNYWTITSDIFSNKDIMWNDPCPAVRTENEETSQGGKENKSFFDPCPPGWRVPSYGSIYAPATSLILPYGTKDYIFEYYPAGDGPSDDVEASQVIRFYHTKNFRMTTGKIQGYYTNNYSWYSKKNDTSSAKAVTVGSTFSINNQSTAYSMMVRCVRED